MSKVIDIRKENISRLMMPFLPEIVIDNPRYGQEEKFDVHFRGKIIGRARLHYRLPFQAKNLRDSQSFLVYNKPKHWMTKVLHDELGEGFSADTWLVYVLLKWEERDLLAFDDIMKQVQAEIIDENPSQHQMQLAI